MKPANKPLKIKIVDDQLVISIGVSTLAYALQNGPDWTGAIITHNKRFAKDVVDELRDDRSQGCDDDVSMVERMLEEAANRAIEGGSRHVELVEEVVS